MGHRCNSSRGLRSFDSQLDVANKTLAVSPGLVAQFASLGIHPPHAQSLLRVLTTTPSAVAAALPGGWSAADVSEATMELWTTLAPFIDQTSVDPSIRIPSRRWVPGVFPAQQPSWPS